MEAGRAEVAEEGVGVTRVLVVDDSPVDRRVAQLLLSSSNSCAGSFHVIAVDSAKKAMEFLGIKDGKEQAIDMVLTDYSMPEMTGYDLLKAVKALNPLKPIPVVVMSSENEPQRISRCLNAGAEDFIVKPLQSKDVQRLRSCSTARHKGSAPCEAVAMRMPIMPPPPSDHRASVSASTASGRFGHFTGLAMVLHSSRMELSQYLPLLFKLVLLVYAVLCLGELMHRWSSGTRASWKDGNSENQWELASFCKDLVPLVSPSQAPSQKTFLRKTQWLRKHHLEQAAASGSRHMLVVPKNPWRPPIVEILTSHDFMPQSMFMDRSRISKSPVEEEAFSIMLMLPSALPFHAPVAISV